VEWLKRLEDEFANMRAALEWSQENRAEDGLQLGSAIWRFCLRYGYTNELVEKLNQLLQHPQGMQRTAIRAKTLYVLSILAGVGQSDRIRQRAQAEESLAISKELGNRSGEAAALYALGVTANFSSDPKTALSLLTQSLVLYRSIDDKINICDVLIVISQVSSDPIQRQAYLEETLALARERGDAITMAGALDNLGTLAMDLGDFPRARSWLEESLEIQLPLGAPGYISTLQYLSKLALYEGNLAQARVYGDEVRTMTRKAGMLMAWQSLWSHVNLGYIAFREGDIAQTKEVFRYSIQQFQKANSLIGVVYTIEGLASLNVNQGQPKRAARLFAWTDAMREKIDDHRPPVEQASVERDLAVIHSKVNDEEFAKLSTEGSTMTIEQAIALALEK
jgi:tetratricopeptide (TPR) repeat protein